MLPLDGAPPPRRRASPQWGQLEDDRVREGEGSEAEKAAAPPGANRRRRRRRRRRGKPPPGETTAATATAGVGCVDEGSEREERHVRRLAIYVAMAHAGLALSLALLYGVARLLEGYWRPIGWALLCSIPLRRLHTALVSFWSLPLRLGLLETLLAVPLAALRAAASSLLDSHSALLRLLHLLQRLRGGDGSGGVGASSPLSGGSAGVGFSKLMQWLCSFGLFTLAHERLGLLSLPAFAAAGLLARAPGGPAPPPVASTLSAISSARYGRGPPPAALLSRAGRCLTSLLLRRLHTLVGLGLIVVIVAGPISGFVFFSYKMGMEGKDAVISIKTHLQEHNYSERIGLRQWMDQYDVPGTIELCTSRFYETASQYVDSIALQYNATDIVEGFRQYLIRPLASPNSSLRALEQSRPRPIMESLRHLQTRVWNAEWKVELEGFLRVLAREDLVGKLRGLALQSVSVSKRVFDSSTMVLSGGANLFLSVVVSIISGATELLNFVSQLTVFFWLLYYLITSDSGGVMDHAMGMLPISTSTRARCVEVLDHAVSSVLLATAKVALFQGFLTYLLFRFYNIHFVYVSTFVAWMSAVLPITPIWLSSIPAAAQLAIEARYFEAVGLTAVHLILLDYGTTVIQDEIPGQSSYLTGLSILGGMALFPSVLEGAVMGPLLMTVMIAVKNLYAEFVLSSAKEIIR
uniref:Transmembrane protein C9orf5 n=1 Tax=Anthurium amnicola TaxID=1678845 RepID=A0A1D1XK43_9ARAE